MDSDKRENRFDKPVSVRAMKNIKFKKWLDILYINAIPIYRFLHITRNKSNTLQPSNSISKYIL